MRHFSQAWRDLFLLLSLLLVILPYPFLDRGDVRRLVLGGLMFAPLLCGDGQNGTDEDLGVAHNISHRTSRFLSSI